MGARGKTGHGGIPRQQAVAVILKRVRVRLSGAAAGEILSSCELARSSGERVPRVVPLLHPIAVAQYAHGHTVPAPQPGYILGSHRILICTCRAPRKSAFVEPASATCFTIIGVVVLVDVFFQCIAIIRLKCFDQAPASRICGHLLSGILVGGGRRRALVVGVFFRILG